MYFSSKSRLSGRPRTAFPRAQCQLGVLYLEFSANTARRLLYETWMTKPVDCGNWSVLAPADSDKASSYNWFRCLLADIASLQCCLLKLVSWLAAVRLSPNAHRVEYAIAATLIHCKYLGPKCSNLRQHLEVILISL